MVQINGSTKPLVYSRCSKKSGSGLKNGVQTPSKAGLSEEVVLRTSTPVFKVAVLLQYKPVYGSVFVVSNSKQNHKKEKKIIVKM